MPGRVISIQFRGAPREVVYTTRGNEADGLTCRFADIPYGESRHGSRVGGYLCDLSHRSARA